MPPPDKILKAIAPAAAAAGMVHDPDALQLLDLGPIALAVDGSPVIPNGYFEAQRRTKPHLFRPTTIPGVPADFNARTATPADYEAAKAATLQHARRR